MSTSLPNASNPQADWYELREIEVALHGRYRCYFCNMIGHIAANCPQNFKAKRFFPSANYIDQLLSLGLDQLIPTNSPQMDIQSSDVIVSSDKENQQTVLERDENSDEAEDQHTPSDENFVPDENIATTGNLPLYKTDDEQPSVSTMNPFITPYFAYRHAYGQKSDISSSNDEGCSYRYPFLSSSSTQCKPFASQPCCTQPISTQKQGLIESQSAGELVSRCSKALQLEQRINEFDEQNAFREPTKTRAYPCCPKPGPPHLSSCPWCKAKRELQDKYMPFTDATPICPNPGPYHCASCTVFPHIIGALE